MILPWKGNPTPNVRLGKLMPQRLIACQAAADWLYKEGHNQVDLKSAHAKQQDFASWEEAFGTGGIPQLPRIDMSSREAGAFGARGTL